MGARPIMIKEAEVSTESANRTPMSQMGSPKSQAYLRLQKEIRAMKTNTRNASPFVVLNRNRSRFIAPADIVRSEAARAEISRQKSHDKVGSTKKQLKTSDKALTKKPSR